MSPQKEMELMTLAKNCKALLQNMEIQDPKEIAKILNFESDDSPLSTMCISKIQKDPKVFLDSSSFFTLNYDALFRLMKNKVFDDVEKKVLVSKVIEWYQNNQKISSDLSTVWSFFLKKRPCILKFLGLEVMTLHNFLTLLLVDFENFVPPKDTISICKYIARERKFAEVLPSWYTDE